jgi:hypothetical protein
MACLSLLLIYIRGKKLISWKKKTENKDNEPQGPGMAKLTLIMKEYPKLDLGCALFQ